MAGEGLGDSQRSNPLTNLQYQLCRATNTQAALEVLLAYDLELACAALTLEGSAGLPLIEHTEGEGVKTPLRCRPQIIAAYVAAGMPEALFLADPTISEQIRPLADFLAALNRQKASVLDACEKYQDDESTVSLMDKSLNGITCCYPMQVAEYWRQLSLETKDWRWWTQFQQPIVVIIGLLSIIAIILAFVQPQLAAVLFLGVAVIALMSTPVFGMVYFGFPSEQAEVGARLMTLDSGRLGRVASDFNQLYPLPIGNAEHVNTSEGDNKEKEENPFLSQQQREQLTRQQVVSIYAGLFESLLWPWHTQLADYLEGTSQPAAQETLQRIVGPKTDDETRTQLVDDMFVENCGSPLKYFLGHRPSAALSFSDNQAAAGDTLPPLPPGVRRRSRAHGQQSPLLGRDSPLRHRRPTIERDLPLAQSHQNGDGSQGDPAAENPLVAAHSHTL